MIDLSDKNIPDVDAIGLLTAGLIGKSWQPTSQPTILPSNHSVLRFLGYLLFNSFGCGFAALRPALAPVPY
jgi:hypothetical protein